MIPGSIEIRMIKTIEISKLFFMMGILPKKYPPQTKRVTQATPPMILKERNLA